MSQAYRTRLRLQGSPTVQSHHMHLQDCMYKVGEGESFEQGGEERSHILMFFTVHQHMGLPEQHSLLFPCEPECSGPDEKNHLFQSRADPLNKIGQIAERTTGIADLFDRSCKVFFNAPNMNKPKVYICSVYSCLVSCFCLRMEAE